MLSITASLGAAREGIYATGLHQRVYALREGLRQGGREFLISDTDYDWGFLRKAWMQYRCASREEGGGRVSAALPFKLVLAFSKVAQVFPSNTYDVTKAGERRDSDEAASAPTLF